ncbi:elongin-C-like [Watersipora subatra]|uniref:elongin-C-like n=1 Tax=Watersipora subatra TaxID=2589382 RepID=UPI00355C54B7
MSDNVTYGGCEGANSAYINLISSDGFTFILKREVVQQSPTLCEMLTGPGASSDNTSSDIYLTSIPSHVLVHVCKYLQYKFRYTNSSAQIPELEFPPEVCLELLMAADFLAC